MNIGVASAAAIASSNSLPRIPDFKIRELIPLTNRPLTVGEYRALRVPSSSAIVIDFGSSTLRAGYSCDSLDAGPRLQFPPFVSRGRDAGDDGIMRVQIGYEALAATSRSAARSPFDGAIANNAILTERLLDGTFARLGLSDEDRIDHPLVLTEPPCQINGVRAQFTEVFFEAYEIPKLCYGVDALFSYLYNRNVQISDGISLSRRSGVVVSCGHHATHVLPVFNARFHAPAAKRINVGGYHMTNDLMRRLQLTSPNWSTVFTHARVEALIRDACYVSQDYGSDLKNIQDDPKVFDSVSKLIKLPSAVPGTADKSATTAEDVERAKLARIERGKRLSEMMKERNKSKTSANETVSSKKSSDKDAATATATEEEMESLRIALSRVRELERIADTRAIDEDLYYLARIQAGFNSESAFTAELKSREAIVASEQRKLGDEQAELVENAWLKKVLEDELIAVSDVSLSTVGLKRKRHLRSLRGAAESRMRLKREKEEALEKVRLREEEELRLRVNNPEGYLASLRAEREELARKIRRRNAAKDAGSDRRSLAARERMRLLAQHAGNKSAVDGGNTGNAIGTAGTRKRDKDKVDDTFGMNDSDWDVYRDMRVRDNGEEDSEDDSLADRTRLERVRTQILEMHPDDEDPTLIKPVGSALLYLPHPCFDELPIVIDRIRIPELLFQPSLIGVEQCGIPEAIELCVNYFDSSVYRQELLKDVFLTGGVANFPRFEDRIRTELKARFPTEWGQDIARGVHLAGNVELDAWRGASLFAESGGVAFETACITKQEYDEKGQDYLQEHPVSNWYVPTPVRQS